MGTVFLKDSYSESFDSMAGLVRRLQELYADGTWIKDVMLRDIRIHPLTRWEDVPENVRQMESMGKEAILDTMSGSGFYVELPTGACYCLREQGVSSIHARAGISGRAYRSLPKETTAGHLNDGLSVASGAGYIRIVGGKLLGIHSELYNPFNMAEAFSAAQEWMTLQYPDAEFIGGTLDHDGARVKYDFSAYYAELFADLFPAQGEVRPVLRVGMGDSAKSSVSVVPEVYVRGTLVPLGDPIASVHRGRGDQMKNFQNALKMIESQFERQIANLQKLARIKLAYPSDCFLNMSAQVGLLRRFTKATKEAAELFEILTVSMAKADGREVTALDVYNGMCWIISQVASDPDKSEADREKMVVRVTSMVARAIKSNWQMNDFPNKERIQGGGE